MGGAAQAANAMPLPPPGKISAHSFRVEKRGQYQGEVNVPSILFIGKAGEPAETSVAKQKRAELSRYKLRPGALEELGMELGDDEEEEMEGTQPRAGGAASPNRKPASYDMAPYGGKREMDSLRRQIVETETAALEARVQSQNTVSKTQQAVKTVEDKVGHVRESNQQLDSELVEIEKQIEELKRISRSQIDEIKALRESNKQKEVKLNSEQQELQRMEGQIRDSMLIAQQEANAAAPAAAGAHQQHQVPHASTKSRAAASVASPAARAPSTPAAAAAATAAAGSSGGGGAAPAALSRSASMVGPGLASGVQAGPGVASGTKAKAAAAAAVDVDGGGYLNDRGDRVQDHEEVDRLLEVFASVGMQDGRIWSGFAGARDAEEQEYLAMHAGEHCACGVGCVCMREHAHACTRARIQTKIHACIHTYVNGVSRGGLRGCPAVVIIKQGAQRLERRHGLDEHGVSAGGPHCTSGGHGDRACVWLQRELVLGCLVLHCRRQDDIPRGVRVCGARYGAWASAIFRGARQRSGVS